MNFPPRGTFCEGVTTFFEKWGHPGTEGGAEREGWGGGLGLTGGSAGA